MRCELLHAFFRYIYIGLNYYTKKMSKKAKNKSSDWPKGKPTSRKLVNGLTKELHRVFRNAKNGRFTGHDVYVRGETKSYKFRELG